MSSNTQAPGRLAAGSSKVRIDLTASDSRRSSGDLTSKLGSCQLSSAGSKKRIDLASSSSRKTIDAAAGTSKKKLDAGSSRPAAPIASCSKKQLDAAGTILSGKPAPKKSISRMVKYSKTEVLAHRALFDAHDKDHSGEIDVRELWEGLSDNPNMAKHWHGTFAVLDKNGDGRITFREWLAVVFDKASSEELDIMNTWGQSKKAAKSVALKPEELEELKAMFILFDTNKNGTLERHEVVAAAGACGYETEEIMKIFEEADVNKDSVLSFEEFVGMIALHD